MWDDMATEENYIHRRFGVEGRDYVDNGDGTYEIIHAGDGSENTEQNLGIKLFQDLFARKDACNIENIEATTELFEKVKNSTDIGDAMKEYTWGVIGGNKSLDDWDSYVANLENLGLQRIVDELTEIHGAQVESYQKYMEEYNK